MDPLPVPDKHTLDRQKDDFSPTGDLFAPFFDVVFYSPMDESGEEITQLEDRAAQLGAVPGAQAAAAGLRAQAAALRAVQAQNLARGTTTPLGPSKLSVRSVGGGLQSYSPAGETTELAELANFRANLQVTMLSAAALQATLTLSPTYEAAIKIIDHKLIRFGSIMELQWGYLALDGSGKPAISDRGLFRITQPAIKFGKQVSITIGGFDILSSSLKTSDTRCQWLRSKYPCDLDIIREIVKKRTASGITLNDKGISNTSSLRKRKSGTGVTQADDDWTFFRRIVRQNDCAFDQTGSEITLKEEKEIDIQKPKYRLLWFKQPVNQFDVPMITFETNPIMSLFAGEPGARGQRTLCRDSETKKKTVINMDPGKTGTPQVGQCNTNTTEAAHKKDVVKTSQGTVGTFAKLDAACTSGRFFTQPCRRPNQVEETKRENNEIRRFFNTRASATCPGVPGLLPQQVVEVHDVGKTFSGNYRVMKVVHNIGKGYTVKLDLLRAAASGVQDAGEPASPDKKNTKKTDENAPVGTPVTPVLEGKATDTSRGGCVDQTKTDALQAKADAARRKAADKAKADAAGAEAMGGPVVEPGGSS